MWSLTGDNTLLPLVLQSLLHSKTRAPQQYMYHKLISKKQFRKKIYLLARRFPLLLFRNSDPPCIQTACQNSISGGL